MLPPQQKRPLMCRTIALFSLLLAANLAVAQEFFVTMNGAYGLGAGTQLVGTSYSPSGTASSVEGVYGSLGEGFKFGVSGGYLFTNHFGAELGLSYWLGKSIDYTYKSSTSTQSSAISGKGFVAVPSLIFLSNLKPVNPYGKFGLVIGLVRSKLDQSVEDPTTDAEITVEDQGGVAIGFAGALGVIVPTGGPVDFFAEVVLHSLTYSPSKYEITKYTVNGQDRLPTLTNKTVDYKESFLTNSPTPVTLSVRRPFSSIGFSLGARMTL
jgi:hypothetical protein